MKSLLSIQNFNTTPLHVAARRGFYEIVDLLLHNGFYINELAKCRMTPLHFACMYGNEKTVETLLHFDPENIEINATTQNQEDGVIDPKYGCNMTPLHFDYKPFHILVLTVWKN